MKTTTKYLLLVLSFFLMVGFYLYLVLWSGMWRWKFWVSGNLEDLVYLTIFTFLWVELMKRVWKWEVSVLFR